jgi:hypothetical protein
MILTKHKSVISLLLAFIFSVLFYKKAFGLNVLFYETIAVTIAYYIHKPNFKNSLTKILFIGTVVSCLMVVLHNSSISKVVNSFSFFLLVGSFTYPSFKLIKNNLYQFIINITKGYNEFRKDFLSRNNRNRKLIHYLKIIIIPILIILLFLVIYYNSNDYFAKLTNSFFDQFGKLFNWLPNINFVMFFILIIGLTIAISIFYGKANNKLINSEISLKEFLTRKRNVRKNISPVGLKSELKSGIFLLLILNCMLIVFNYTDITTVWFSYNWDGGYLKEFVHLGTYLLIVSLILSIAIVLYYFRGNLNFYRKNNTLKILTYIWLAQNIILIISLVIRNNIYIHHFALAYKRIGVYVFLIAALFGIYSIIIKVKNKKSYYYVIKNNTIVIYTLFIFLTCVNWDVFIAKHNVSSYKESFIEMEYLLDLSDKALPYINIEPERLIKMDRVQSSSFSFKSRYISVEDYSEYLKQRIDNYIESYPKRSLLEWNYADYVAYNKLK